MARLQTFPDDVSFVGSRVAIQRQIGNAVPSLITEILGRSIQAQFFGSKPIGKLKLAIPVRHPVPPAEKIAAVPSRFKPLPPEKLVETEPRYIRVKRERKAQDGGLMEV
jgi:DNA (cytosine-5)-methyltransferase 1